MTEDQYVALCADWDALFAKHRVVLSEGDYVLDSLMLMLAATVEHEKQRESNKLVTSCLDGCIRHLQNAAMDYYVSTK